MYLWSNFLFQICTSRLQHNREKNTLSPLLLRFSLSRRLSLLTLTPPPPQLFLQSGFLSRRLSLLTGDAAAALAVRRLLSPDLSPSLTIGVVAVQFLESESDVNMKHPTFPSSKTVENCTWLGRCSTKYLSEIDSDHVNPLPPNRGNKHRETRVGGENRYYQQLH
ncbi:hypothetical protein L1887_26793 [Cichorium endivia]|nr:hypothetical protein L1887_26793 [Cichorium endivia]